MFPNFSATRPARSTAPAVALFAVLLVAAAGCALEPLAPTAAPIRSPASSAAPLPGAVRTVVIDAGHGGHDPGTSHFGLKEKNLVLDMAKRLRAELQGLGLNVVMTRETDKFIPLSGRPAVANRLKADLFISVHVNANRSSRVAGVEVYYPRTSVVSSSAQWPPAVTASEVSLPSTTVKQMLWDLVLRRTRTQSRKLGQEICRSLRDGLQAPCRAVKPAKFVVLREAWMPAVLVEVGYVSNRQEATRLGTAEYRAAAAQAIARGVVSYIRSLGVQHI